MQNIAIYAEYMHLYSTIADRMAPFRHKSTYIESIAQRFFHFKYKLDILLCNLWLFLSHIDKNRQKLFEKA